MVNNLQARHKREAIHKATFSHLRYNDALCGWIFCLHTKEGGNYFGSIADFYDGKDVLKSLRSGAQIYIGARPLSDGNYWLHFLYVSHERGLYPVRPLCRMFFWSRRFRKRMLEDPAYADKLSVVPCTVVGKSPSLFEPGEIFSGRESDFDVLVDRLASISSPRAKEAPMPRNPEPLYYELRVGEDYMEVRVELRQFEAFLESFRLRPPFFLGKGDNLRVAAQSTPGGYEVVGIQNMEDGKIYVRHFGTVTAEVRRMCHVFTLGTIAVVFPFLCFAFLDKEGFIFFRSFSGALFLVSGIYALSVEMRYREVRSGKLNKKQRLAQKALDILGGGRLYRPRPEVTMI